MSVTFSLLRLLAWRRLKEEPFRLALTLVGVALGVAVFLAVKMANETSTRAFENSLVAISGKTQLEVSAGGLGVDENLILRLRAMKEVKRAAPVIQQHVWIRKAGGAGSRSRRGAPSLGRAVLALGLDLMSSKISIRARKFSRASPTRRACSSPGEQPMRWASGQAISWISRPREECAFASGVS
ncbi:MAG: hypothetical protein J4F48_08730 [Nitrospinae bacterium]|nr:hypothetical protein [Nitrospinota bacterium]